MSCAIGGGDVELAFAFAVANIAIPDTTSNITTRILTMLFPTLETGSAPVSQISNSSSYFILQSSSVFKNYEGTGTHRFAQSLQCHDDMEDMYEWRGDWNKGKYVCMV